MTKRVKELEDQIAKFEKCMEMPDLTKWKHNVWIKLSDQEPPTRTLILLGCEETETNDEIVVLASCFFNEDMTIYFPDWKKGRNNSFPDPTHYMVIEKVGRG